MPRLVERDAVKVGLLPGPVCAVGDAGCREYLVWSPAEYVSLRPGCHAHTLSLEAGSPWSPCEPRCRSSSESMQRVRRTLQLADDAAEGVRSFVSACRFRRSGVQAATVPEAGDRDRGGGHHHAGHGDRVATGVVGGQRRRHQQRQPTDSE
jgi:hypothetical protein